MQYHAVAKDFNPFAFHNVATLSLVTLCSAAYLGRALYKASERSRRTAKQKLAEIQLIEEVEVTNKDPVTAPCSTCERHRSAIPATSVPVVTPTSASKKPKKDRKGKGIAIPAPSPALSPPRDPPPATRTVAVQTDPLPAPSHYPSEEILAFTRANRPMASTSGTRSDDEIDSIAPSPSLLRIAKPSHGTSTAPTSLVSSSVNSRETSVSSTRSGSYSISDASTSSSVSVNRGRRSSSGATTMSTGNETMALTDSRGYMTPPTSARKARKASIQKREVVGLPKAPSPMSQSPTDLPEKPLPPVAPEHADPYWTQDPKPSTSMPVTAPTIQPAPPAKTKPTLAIGVMAGHGSVRSPQPSPKPRVEPRRASLTVDHRPIASTSALPPPHHAPASYPSPRNTHPASLSAYTFSPPASPSPVRITQHHAPPFASTSQHPLPPPSPSFFAGRAPPAYSPNDAMAHAAQQAYAIAQQQMYLVAQQQRLNQQQMAYQSHPYNVHPAAAAAFNSPSLGVGNLSRATSFDFGVDGGKNDVERLREQIGVLQRKTKKAEIENERKHKELEIARWRLECVETERKQDDKQTQEAICFFVERAEAAEKRVKELEAKLGIPSEASLSSSSEPEGATGEASTSLQVLEPHPTRPSSPAAIASLERLDLASLARPSSPSSSSALSPRVNYSSPSIGSPSFGGVRRRRSKRQGRPTTDSPARNGVNGFTSDDDDDLVITLTSPATSACTSSTTVPAPSRLSLPPSVIGLGIGSSASSEAGEGDDEAETEPEEDDSETEEAFGGESAQLAPVPLGMDVRVQPATPDGTELAAVA